MLFKLLSGVTLNTDAVIFYEPYSLREYFSTDELAEDADLTTEEDPCDLFDVDELDAMNTLWKSRPQLQDLLIVAYAAKTAGGIVWLRADEYRQLLETMMHAGVRRFEAKATLLSSLGAL